jgi:hypothetical protein
VFDLVVEGGSAKAFSVSEFVLEFLLGLIEGVIVDDRTAI